MPTVTISGGDLTLKSKWKAKKIAGKRGNAWYEFETGPTKDTQTITFNYSLPSGAKITNAQICCSSMTSPPTGWAIRNVNGNPFNDNKASVTLGGNNGPYSATFSFKANGSLTDENQHISPLTLSGIYLQIDYEGDEDEPDEPDAKPIAKSGFSIPPQSCCVYDQETGAVYMFDGVTKIQHNLTMKIEQEPEKHKDEYVNNAKNEPDKVTLDIVMSDVYSGNGAITNARGFTDLERTAYNATKGLLLARNSGDAWPRSENAFYVLHDLKEARKKLSVITPQFVHTDMLIASITVSQDEEHPFGWEGQIVFQHAFDVKEEKKATNSKATTTTDQAKRTAAVGYLAEPMNSLATYLTLKHE